MELIEIWGKFRLLRIKKVELADLLDTRAQGALVRSRFQSISEMDAPSRFFFSLEKKNCQKKSIQCLRSVDGKDLTGDSDIRKRAVSFYRELYACECGEDQSTNHLLSDLRVVVCWSGASFDSR